MYFCLISDWSCVPTLTGLRGQLSTFSVFFFLGCVLFVVPTCTFSEVISMVIDCLLTCVSLVIPLLTSTVSSPFIIYDEHHDSFFMFTSRPWERLHFSASHVFQHLFAISALCSYGYSPDDFIYVFVYWCVLLQWLPIFLTDILFYGCHGQKDDLASPLTLQSSASWTSCSMDVIGRRTTWHRLTSD